MPEDLLEEGLPELTDGVVIDGYSQWLETQAHANGGSRHKGDEHAEDGDQRQQRVAVEGP